MQPSWRDKVTQGKEQLDAVSSDLIKLAHYFNVRGDKDIYNGLMKAVDNIDRGSGLMLEGISDYIGEHGERGQGMLAFAVFLLVVGALALMLLMIVDPSARAWVVDTWQAVVAWLSWFNNLL